MKKHASSHGLAVFFCTICSGWLVRLSYDHHPLAMEYMERISEYFIKILSLNFSSGDLSSLIIAVMLAMVWGMCFKIIHKDGG